MEEIWKDIAELFKTTQTNISSIKLHKTWNHIV